MFCRSMMMPLQLCSRRLAMARRKNWMVSIVSRPCGSRITRLPPTYSEIFIRAFFLPVHAQEERPSAHVLQLSGSRGSFAVNGERQQDVARGAAGRVIAGVEEHHAAADGGAGAVDGAAPSFDAVD